MNLGYWTFECLDMLKTSSDSKIKKNSVTVFAPDQSHWNHFFHKGHRLRDWEVWLSSGEERDVLMVWGLVEADLHPYPKGLTPGPQVSAFYRKIHFYLPRRCYKQRWKMMPLNESSGLEAGVSLCYSLIQPFTGANQSSAHITINIYLHISIYIYLDDR